MTATKTNVTLAQSDDNSNSLGAKKAFPQIDNKKIDQFL